MTLVDKEPKKPKGILKKSTRFPSPTTHQTSSHPKSTSSVQNITTCNTTDTHAQKITWDDEAINSHVRGLYPKITEPKTPFIHWNPEDDTLLGCSGNVYLSRCILDPRLIC
jgi:hypothetical protein